MHTKRAKEALLEMIPPRICITFRRASFWSGPKNSKSRLWKGWTENTITNGPVSHGNFSKKVGNHEDRSELDPSLRAETQAIWNLKVLWIQWNLSGTPKLPYKIQNRQNIQWIPPGPVYAKLFRQPYRLTPQSRNHQIMLEQPQHWSWIILSRSWLSTICQQLNPPMLDPRQKVVSTHPQRPNP